MIQSSVISFPLRRLDQVVPVVLHAAFDVEVPHEASFFAVTPGRSVTLGARLLPSDDVSRCRIALSREGLSAAVVFDGSWFIESGDGDRVAIDAPPLVPNVLAAVEIDAHFGLEGHDRYDRVAVNGALQQRPKVLKREVLREAFVHEEWVSIGLANGGVPSSYRDAWELLADEEKTKAHEDGGFVLRQDEPAVVDEQLVPAPLARIEETYLYYTFSVESDAPLAIASAWATAES